MEPSITIFWIDITDDEAAILDRVAREHHAHLVPIKFRYLPALTFAALAQGPVVFVARTSQEATQALGIGVDEVIRMGEIRADALTATLARARARAAARSAYDLRRGLFQDDDELALAALSSAFGNQLSKPLASASLECELLESALASVLDVGDKFVECTIRRAEPEQNQDLAVRRLALAPSHELKRLLADVRDGLKHARVLATTLSGLASRTTGDGAASITRLVADVVDVMRPDFAPWAVATVNAEGDCRVSVAPVTVAFVLSALVVNAVDAVRVARREGGRIEVRLSEHEDAVVLEVEDNGRPISADLRPTVFEPYFNLSRANRTGLVRVRERMRRCGGDVTVDSGDSGTTVRVLLPTSSDDALFGAEPTATPSAKKKPADTH